MYIPTSLLLRGSIGQPCGYLLRGGENAILWAGGGFIGGCRWGRERNFGLGDER